MTSGSRVVDRIFKNFSGLEVDVRGGVGDSHELQKLIGCVFHTISFNDVANQGKCGNSLRKNWHKNLESIQDTRARWLSVAQYTQGIDK